MDIALGTLQIMQSALFVEYPLLIQTGKIKLVVIIMFSREFSDFPASCPFERIRDILVEFTPITLKYPFAILGISNSPSELRVDELTSAMDQYLIGSIGMTLDEMRLLGERPRFEFKAVFPHENSRKFFHPVTAFANQRGGGVILIGIDDTTGNIIGVPKGKPLDDLQLAIKDCIRNNCKPIPKFEIEIFDSPTDTSQCLVVVQIHEIEHKPCMADDKVYIRVGSASQAAGPDEIRRLLLG